MHTHTKVCVPYLRAKAQDYFESFGGGVPPDLLEDGASHRTQALTDPVRQIHSCIPFADSMSAQSMKGHLRRAFMTLYPWLNTAFEVWLMTWNVAYLFDRTPHYRPWLAWIGVDLRRLGADDFVSPCVVWSVHVPTVAQAYLRSIPASGEPLSPDSSVEPSTAEFIVYF
jgi:peroxin-12